MAKSGNEREEDKRQERLQHMREQIASGDLVVRQMTSSERRLWEERAAAFDEHSTPEERIRRDAAWQRRQERATREHNRRDALPPS
jgi:glycine/D-amino acid oxidase-like deaminating enzyme